MLTKGNNPDYLILCDKPFKEGDITEIYVRSGDDLFVYHKEDGCMVGEPKSLDWVFVEMNKEWDDLMKWLHSIK